MKHAMACEDARMLFALLLYGELSFDEEERVDVHLDGCMECRGALEREKSLHAAFDSVAVEPAASLLRECRTELAASVRREPGVTQDRSGSKERASGWWSRFTGILTGPSVLRPVGAVALIALGFFIARLTPFSNESLAGARVSDIETQADGSVKIVVDETRKRTIAGNLDDQLIRAKLLEAVRDPSNPGLREDSVSLLSRHPQSAEIRGALVYLIGHDQDDGVRLKAMDGLKAFAADPEVRDALSRALLSDANPGVRTQAINLLIQGPDEHSAPTIDRAMIGTLQELMLRENNPGVRQRAQRLLEAINASAEIY
jgi:HEAT repeats/Putative zinc-finger